MAKCRALRTRVTHAFAGHTRGGEGHDAWRAVKLLRTFIVCLLGGVPFALAVRARYTRVLDRDGTRCRWLLMVLRWGAVPGRRARLLRLLLLSLRITGGVGVGARVVTLTRAGRELRDLDVRHFHKH